MATGSSTTILVVDDNVATRRMVRTLLTHLGFPRVGETTGTNSLERLREKQLDLILSDADLTTVTDWTSFARCELRKRLNTFPSL